MTFWRGVLIVAILECAVLAIWHPGVPQNLPLIMPVTEPAVIQLVNPPPMATEQVCRVWGYPEEHPVETHRICVDRQVPSPFGMAR